MSIYLTNDGGDPEFLASNLGWSEFGEWTDKLDHHKYGEVVTLWEHGWSQEVADLMKELKAASTKEKTDADTLAVVTSLIELADGAEVVTITDGFGKEEKSSKSLTEKYMGMAGYSDEEMAERLKPVKETSKEL